MNSFFRTIRHTQELIQDSGIIDEMFMIQETFNAAQNAKLGTHELRVPLFKTVHDRCIEKMAGDEAFQADLMAKFADASVVAAVMTAIRAYVAAS